VIPWEAIVGLAALVLLPVGWVVKRNIDFGERIAALERWETAQNGRLGSLETAVKDGFRNLGAKLDRALERRRS